MSNQITQLTSGNVYLDTMILYHQLRASNASVMELFQRIEDGALQAYTAVLTFDEVAYRLLLGLIRNRYGNSPLDRLRENQAAMIDEFYALIETQLNLLQRFPNLNVVAISAVDLAAMHRNVRQFRLLPRDALHLALMQRIGCTNLVSEDSDFDTVTGITRFVLV